ncbi:unnamed protein product [Caenorhabditis auriculariae]|uniref:Solute carrier family 25 member 40 n=1 Tax=Caenorhabditis auriculariae TaxID=2777116 RepID=A0A8S1GYV5_9PELO|nr:unnamed protein product [Caenorhabditis auriculariae]
MDDSQCERRPCCEKSLHFPKRPECETRKVNVWQQVVASCSGAVVTSVLMTPLDVVKIRLQQQHHPFPKGECFYYHNGLMEHLCTACDLKKPCEWYQRPGNFTGTWDAMKKITAHEGVSSLWSGMTPTLVMALPATIFYFTIYDNLSGFLKKKIICRRATYPEKTTPPEWTAAMVAGTVARAIAVSVVSPVEMIRTKIQSQNMSYSEVRTAIRSSIQHKGLRSFYMGWTPTILRDIPFSAIYWAGYDFLKKSMTKGQRPDDAHFTVSFAAGAISGSVASVLTHPFDVIKTNSQVRIGKSGAELGKSMKTIAHELYSTRGSSAFYTGLLPRVIKVAPACAIMIGSYEYCKTFFHKRNKAAE